MNVKGLRISDIKDGKCVPLLEILKEIPQASTFSWELLWLDVTPNKKDGEVIDALQNKVNKSENGLPCQFDLLIEISGKIFQELEVLIIGCKVKEHLHRYQNDQQMYETCDIVIEMIDGGFWEIFSTNISWINQLAKKYTEVEFLQPDFQNRFFKN